jgi:hypothetical protein
VRTPNGTAIRTATGWVWLCDTCSQTFTLGLAPDLQLDVHTVLHQVDAMHWCAKKGDRS